MNRASIVGVCLSHRITFHIFEIGVANFKKWGNGFFTPDCKFTFTECNVYILCKRNEKI